MNVHLTIRFMSRKLSENSMRAHTAVYVSELDRGRLGSRRGDHGATALEYALMVGLIAVVIVASVTLFGVNVSGLFNVPASAF